MAAQLIFPLQFVRQFDGPIDADMVFDTEVNMNKYLSSARRYAGQIATCLEKEGSVYVMSSDLSKWIEIGIAELEAAKVIEDGEHRFMTDEEKAKLLSIAPGAQDNVIETISVKGVNISPVDKNIDLFNVVTDDELETKADKNELTALTEEEINLMLKRIDELDPSSPEASEIKQWVENRIAKLVNSSPETLETLNELSEALGNDQNLATTITTQLGKIGMHTSDSPSDSDLDVADENGNVILRLQNGHIQTKNFYSGNMTISDDSSDADLNISDTNGNVLCQFKNGHIKTKNFNSAELDKSADVTKSQYLYKLDSSMTDINLGGFINKNGVLYSNNNFDISNSLILNREYALSTKYMVCDFSLEQNGVAYFHTVKGIDPSVIVGATMVSVDITNKKLCIHKTSSGGKITDKYKETSITSMYANEKYRICIAKLNWNIVVTLYDLKTLEIIANLTGQCYDWNTISDGAGYAYDKFAIFSKSANITIYNILVNAPIKTCELMIYGDSITEGLYAVTEDKTYGHLIGEKIGLDKILVSGRASGKINGVLERLKTEAAIIKPKYIAVMIGTNGGNTVENIVKMGNLIASIGAIPIINTIICSKTSVQGHVNNIIRAGIQELKNSGINVLSVNLDVATSLNKDLSQGPDKSYFNIKEGLHPNDAGHQAMMNQFLIDVPEIFNW